MTPPDIAIRRRIFGEARAPISAARTFRDRNPLWSHSICCLFDFTRLKRPDSGFVPAVLFAGQSDGRPGENFRSQALGPCGFQQGGRGWAGGDDDQAISRKGSSQNLTC